MSAPEQQILIGPQDQDDARVRKRETKAFSTQKSKIENAVKSICERHRAASVAVFIQSPFSSTTWRAVRHGSGNGHFDEAMKNFLEKEFLKERGRALKKVVKSNFQFVVDPLVNDDLLQQVLLLGQQRGLLSQRDVTDMLAIALEIQETQKSEF